MYMSKHPLLIGAASLLLSSLLFSGCIKDCRTCCDWPLRLSIEVGVDEESVPDDNVPPVESAPSSRASVFPSVPGSGHDGLPENLRLFLYSSTDGSRVSERYVRSSELTDGSLLDWKVPVGSYDLVIVGGSPSRYFLSGTESLSEGVVGPPDVSADEVQPHVHSHLYYGRKSGIVIDGDLSARHLVKVRSLSKDLRLSVVNSGDLSALSGLSCSVTSNGGEFTLCLTAVP